MTEVVFKSLNIQKSNVNEYRECVIRISAVREVYASNVIGSIPESNLSHINCHLFGNSGIDKGYGTREHVKTSEKNGRGRIKLSPEKIRFVLGTSSDSGFSHIS